MLKNITNDKYKTYLKKYEKLRDNNLPTPCSDSDNQDPSYVYFSNTNNKNLIFRNTKEMVLDNSLVSAFSKITNKIVNYAYTCKKWIKNNNKVEPVVGYKSSSSFEEVVKSLYDYPESFSIPSSYEKDYSQQQLDYLIALQKYLLFIGLKDKEYGNNSLKRYNNQIHQKYVKAGIWHLNKKDIKKIINGEVNYIVTGYVPGIPEYKRYKVHERQELITDEEYNIRALIEYTHSITKDYKVAKIVEIF